MAAIFSGSAENAENPKNQDLRVGKNFLVSQRYRPRLPKNPKYYGLAPWDSLPNVVNYFQDFLDCFHLRGKTWSVYIVMYVQQ